MVDFAKGNNKRESTMALFCNQNLAVSVESRSNKSPHSFVIFTVNAQRIQMFKDDEYNSQTRKNSRIQITMILVDLKKTYRNR